MKKYVYFFGEGQSEGRGDMRDVLGGKGAGLAEMTRAGLPVPPGFTISTEACHVFTESDGQLGSEIESQIQDALGRLEKLLGLGFGDPENLLLVSVRSGARYSMPGMMDTILNLGLGPAAVAKLGERTGNPRFAWDAYRRLVQMFGEVVMGVAKNVFDDIFEHARTEAGGDSDTAISAADFREISAAFKAAIQRETGREFPDNPTAQLQMAIHAVFDSWNNPRAIHYRRMNDIPGDLGTAVNVQAMVFGNMGETSGTGVGFTRDPSTGSKEFFGEYLINAQGEDVVAGVRTPTPIRELAREMPEVYEELHAIAARLEHHYRDVQDFEFTIQEGRLFMLQTRSGKRTGPAAVRIATEMVEEGLISEREAVMRVDPSQLEQLLHPRLDPEAACRVLACGLPASPGAATGRITFSSDEAVERSKSEPVILVRKETVPDDIQGMEVASGVLTARGGMTSHAAVVARGMGKCCVTGVEELVVDEHTKTLRINGQSFGETDYITLDGTEGRVIQGRVATIEADPSTGPFAKFMAMADGLRRLRVRANADTVEEARIARRFGAEGIGLCRTEHMFFEEDRLSIVQEMILASSEKQRRAALRKLLPFQRDDFESLFRVMAPHPVTIRLLDPPLHEFLPKKEDLMAELDALREHGAETEQVQEKEALLRRVDELSESNPMMGHRGCRLGITYPEISEMQVRAIMLAACALRREGLEIIPEIMVPLVGLADELAAQKKVVDRVAREVCEEQGGDVPYRVGTMIELPRAAVTADEIAVHAEFFSFGTNDLTQMTFGFSRDDASRFIGGYLRRGILENDPFQILDQAGVGALVRVACEKGRHTRSGIKLGVCGEHGGDPTSIEFFDRLGLDYVSCSPYRLPVARLASAQAIVADRSESTRTV